MRQIKIIKLVTILLSFSFLASGCCFLGKPSCFSCPGKLGWRHEHKCPFEGRFMKMPCCVLKNKEKLGLTAEQQTKIKDLCTNTKKNSIQLKADIKKTTVDLKAKLMEETLNVQAVNSLIDKKFELKKQLVKSLINSHATLLATLTADQKAKFKEIMKDCKKECCGGTGKCHDSGKCCNDDDDCCDDA